jgi:hypothetical protein
MSSGAFAPLGGKAGLTRDAGRTSRKGPLMQAPTTRPLTTFDLAFARARALEAFYHPFAYTAATADGAL